MNATAAPRPRPLILAIATGALTAAVLHSAMTTPWLSLLVRSPGQIDWLNTANALQRFVAVLKGALVITAIYSLFLLGLAALIEYWRQHSLRRWLIAGTLGLLPLALLALFLANDPFDCFTNCEPSAPRSLVVVSATLIPGMVGTWVAWLVRYAGRSTAA